MNTTLNHSEKNMTNLLEHTQAFADRAKEASRKLVLVTGEQKNAWLKKSAELILAHSKEIQEENQKDLDKAEDYGLNAAAIEPKEIYLLIATTIRKTAPDNRHEAGEMTKKTPSPVATPFPPLQ